MGTHISKVKSVDLDVWTPEQMAVSLFRVRHAGSVLLSHLCSRYRSGVIDGRTCTGRRICDRDTFHLISTLSHPNFSPPLISPRDSKMDSYIRSKYETRRWAREGPPPEDPSVLESEAPSAAPVPEPTSATAAPVSPNPSNARTSVGSRPVQTHQLLSSTVASRQQPVAQPSAPAPPAQPIPQQPQQPQASAMDLFSLDFHAPAVSPAPAEAPKKDVKNEILSLFSTAAPAQAVPQNPYAQGMFGAAPAQQQPYNPAAYGAQPQAAWGQVSVQSAVQQPQQPTSMMGNAGVGMWGASSGWNASPAGVPAQQNIWGAPVGAVQQPQSLFTTSDVWGAPSGNGAASGGLSGLSTGGTQKKDDAFADIWGGFK